MQRVGNNYKLKLTYSDMAGAPTVLIVHTACGTVVQPSEQPMYGDSGIGWAQLVRCVGMCLHMSDIWSAAVSVTAWLLSTARASSMSPLE